MVFILFSFAVTDLTHAINKQERRTTRLIAEHSVVVRNDQERLHLNLLVDVSSLKTRRRAAINLRAQAPQKISNSGSNGPDGAWNSLKNHPLSVPRITHSDSSPQYNVLFEYRKLRLIFVLLTFKLNIWNIGSFVIHLKHQILEIERQDGIWKPQRVKQSVPVLWVL